ncbi:MAG: DNA gyrase subunit A [Bacillota bacterium]|nr:DNA gyrase subunit A [Bacillota bacterium]
MEYGEGRIIPVQIEEEMKRSYLDYAMSVIVERALPDVRDGLKPVQRRILYGMYELGLTPDKPHKKSARIVGDVMGRYHPHGDAAIYESMVRMAQDFSFRYLLVDGHGNFGSVDGDPPAAMRYTEARLSPLAMEMLADIDKDTVDFVPNFDGTMQQPVVLPARFPNLLVNGSAGIAVGMATNIPPHNLGEVIDGLIMLIDRPEATVAELMQVIKGPDFPTGGIILGRDGIRQAYETGRGSLQVRARVGIEEAGHGKTRLVVTEIPYLVNKAALIEKIAELVREKKVEGITDLRDESDRHGLRIVIELRRDVSPRVVLNQLYKHTQLQDTFGVIMLALVRGRPQILNLKEMLQHYLEYQQEVVTRRTRFELTKAEERAHILEGLRIALDHLDEVIALIRHSRTDAEAKEGLMSRFGLTEVQAVAILDMRLRRLTGLEREKIDAEYRELQERIAYLRAVLADVRQVLGIIKEELRAIKEKFADARRTEIGRPAEEIEEEDLILEEEIVITLTRSGYIKRLPLDSYRAQRRGGRGVIALSTREEDFVEHLLTTTTHTDLFFITNLGRAYRLRAHQVPESSRQARGTALVNLLALQPGEAVNAVLPVRDYGEGRFLFMATRSGVVKKIDLAELEKVRSSGARVVLLDEGDEVVGALLTDGRQQIILVSARGQAIRFPEEEVRPLGRAARGVRGMSLAEGDAVVGLDVARPQGELLTISRWGYGKRTPLEEYRSTSRGGKGIRTLRITAKNGPIVGVRVVSPEDEILLISAAGIIIRMRVLDIPAQGRDAQGVRIMKLEEHDTVRSLAVVPRNGEEEQPLSGGR